MLTRHNLSRQEEGSDGGRVALDTNGETAGLMRSWTLLESSKTCFNECLREERVNRIPKEPRFSNSHACTDDDEETGDDLIVQSPLL